MTGKQASIAGGFFGDQPLAADFAQLQRFAAGYSQSAGPVVLAEFGNRFVGVDRHVQVFQLDADVGLGRDALAAFMLPGAA